MTNFRKVIIYGHKLNSLESHTHAFEHHLYWKTFRIMGYETLWVDEYDDLSGLDLSNCLFVTIGGASNRIPLRKDCKYIVHNPEDRKYDEVIDNVLVNQIYSKEIKSREVEVLYEPFYFERKNSSGYKTLYHPWCSDVDPTEVKHFSTSEILQNRQKVVNFVGTVYPPGEWSNIKELQDLDKACSIKYASPLRISKAVGQAHIDLMRSSFIAPAVQGRKSCELQLGVSRPYKIASYGRVPCTNSRHVFEVLEGFAGYSSSIEEAVERTVALEESMTDLQYKQMVNLVTSKYSYRNQVEVMLSLL